MSTDRRPATFHSLQEIGRDTYIITFHADDDEALDYEPGHVLSFACTDDEGNDLRKPYTIIACDPGARLFSFTFRHIPDGKMTSYLSNIKEGAAAQFWGKGHEPISVDINDDATAVVGVGTGSGVGPLYGYISKHIEDIKVPHRFFFGYRDVEDICLKAELDALAAKQPLFTWEVSLSNPPADWDGLKGRIHFAAASKFALNKTTHVHMVGNGHMISELRTALIRINLPTEFISKESFFKHGEPADAEVVQQLMRALTAK